ncbi:MAG: hypothetical protein H6679_01115 [Epsilonproteobacteria bacterium]|nr:hypothetical protein [Campylobacterota bacterium]
MKPLCTLLIIFTMTTMHSTYGSGRNLGDYDWYPFFRQEEAQASPKKSAVIQTSATSTTGPRSEKNRSGSTSELELEEETPTSQSNGPTPAQTIDPAQFHKSIMNIIDKVGDTEDAIKKLEQIKQIHPKIFQNKFTHAGAQNMTYLHIAAFKGRYRLVVFLVEEAGIPKTSVAEYGNGKELTISDSALKGKKVLGRQGYDPKYSPIITYLNQKK